MSQRNKTVTQISSKHGACRTNVIVKFQLRLCFKQSSKYAYYSRFCENSLRIVAIFLLYPITQKGYDQVRILVKETDKSLTYRTNIIVKFSPKEQCEEANVYW